LDLLPGYSHVLIDFPQKSQKSLDFGIVPKERRQIIIVTHNPNLAVVCDADTVPKSSDFDKHHICIFYGFTPMLF
jgi:hypothetical protein